MGHKKMIDDSIKKRDEWEEHSKDSEDVKKAIIEAKEKMALADKTTIMLVEFHAFKMRSPGDLLECMKALNKGIKGYIPRDEFLHMPKHLQSMAKIISVEEVEVEKND